MKSHDIKVTQWGSKAILTSHEELWALGIFIHKSWNYIRWLPENFISVLSGTQGRKQKVFGITEKEKKIKQRTEYCYENPFVWSHLEYRGKLDLAVTKMLRISWLAHHKKHFSPPVSCLLSKIPHCNKDQPIVLRTLNSSTALVIQGSQSILQRKISIIKLRYSWGNWDLEQQSNLFKTK